MQLNIFFSLINSTKRWMQHDNEFPTMTPREATQAAEICCSCMERGTAGLQLVPSGLSMRAIPTAANSFLIESDFSYSLLIRALVLSSIFCSTWSSVSFARFNAFSISCCNTCSTQKLMQVKMGWLAIIAIRMNDLVHWMVFSSRDNRNACKMEALESPRVIHPWHPWTSWIKLLQLNTHTQKQRKNSHNLVTPVLCYGT